MNGLQIRSFLQITCLLVVDVLSQGRTPQQPKRTSLKMSTRSWPCVAVGHQSGHITFYTEDGVTLLRQRLHEGAVISIKCRTGWGTLGSSPVDEVRRVNCDTRT